TSFGKQHIYEGHLQSKDLQKDLFSISCLPSRAAQNACAESGVYPDRKAILLRVSEAPGLSRKATAFISTPHVSAGYERQAIQSPFRDGPRRSKLSRPAPHAFPLWKSSGNSVGSAD